MINHKGAVSLGGAFADEHVVTVRRLSYPPVLTDFDDAERVPTDVETPSVQPATDLDFGHLYGRPPVIRTLYDQISEVSDTLATVLIMGESGTDKELITCTVHDVSPRTDQAFIVVNCSTVSPDLIESKLFGRGKGSFTGASQRHIGYFGYAYDDAIFLDEVTEMPVEMQVKLLRVLEASVFMRVGSIEPIQTRARIIVATNRNLLEAVSGGVFHEGLIYRLAVVPLHVSLLRDRDDDIEGLALHFLAQFNAAHQTGRVFSRQALMTLRIQTWPDNVRELCNAVHRGYILGEKTVELAMPLAQTRGPARPTMEKGVLSLLVGVTLADAQRAMVMATLEYFHGNKRQATRTLNVSLKTLYNRLDLYQSTAAAAMVT